MDGCDVFKHPDANDCVKLSNNSVRRILFFSALVAVILALAGCGGGSNRASSDSRAIASSSSIAGKLVPEIAPIDGADVTAGSELVNTAAAIHAKQITACTSKVGFDQTLPTGVEQQPYGNRALPNLPAIEHAQRLGLITRVTQSDSSIASMGSAEKKAYDAAYARCARKIGLGHSLFGVLRGPSASALTNKWFSILAAVEASAAVVSPMRAARACLSAHGSPATSLETLYLEYSTKEMTAINHKQSPAESDGQAARLVVECFTPAINETTRLLLARRKTFLAQNALAFRSLGQQAASAEHS